MVEGKNYKCASQRTYFYTNWFSNWKDAIKFMKKGLVINLPFGSNANMA